MRGDKEGRKKKKKDTKSKTVGAIKA